MPLCKPEHPGQSLVGVLVESIARLLETQGHLPQDQAMGAAVRAVEDLLWRMGGRKYYLPLSGGATKCPIRDRNRAIRQAWRRGAPVSVILRTFHIKKSQFYVILAEKEAV